MQKKWLIIGGAFILLFAFVVGMYQSNTVNSAPNLNEEDVEALILEQYPGDVKNMTLDKKNKHAIYTADLVYEDKAFQVQVDGDSGEIVHVKEKSGTGSSFAEDNKDNAHNDMLEEKEKPDQSKDQHTNDQKEKPEKNPDHSVDKDNDKQNNNNGNNNGTDKGKGQQTEEKPKDEPNKQSNEQKDKVNSSNSKDSQTVLTAIDAIGAVKKEFSGVVIDLEREKSNGRVIYELELVGNGEKAEVELDAMTGAILSMQIKADQSAVDKYSSVPLSMAEAIKIAQGEFTGTVVEVELEYDDGRFEYEIELVNKGREAEIVVDGHSGAILEYDID